MCVPGYCFVFLLQICLHLFSFTVQEEFSKHASLLTLVLFLSCPWRHHSLELRSQPKVRVLHMMPVEIPVYIPEVFKTENAFSLLVYKSSISFWLSHDSKAAYWPRQDWRAMESSDFGQLFPVS